MSDKYIEGKSGGSFIRGMNNWIWESTNQYIERASDEEDEDATCCFGCWSGIRLLWNGLINKCRSSIPSLDTNNNQFTGVFYKGELPPAAGFSHPPLNNNDDVFSSVYVINLPEEQESYPINVDITTLESISSESFVGPSHAPSIRSVNSCHLEISQSATSCTRGPGDSSREGSILPMSLQVADDRVTETSHRGSRPASTPDQFRGTREKSVMESDALRTTSIGPCGAWTREGIHQAPLSSLGAVTQTTAANIVHVLPASKPVSYHNDTAVKANEGPEKVSAKGNHFLREDSKNCPPHPTTARKSITEKPMATSSQSCTDKDKEFGGHADKLPPKNRNLIRTSLPITAFKRQQSAPRTTSCVQVSPAAVPPQRSPSQTAAAPPTNRATVDSAAAATVDQLRGEPLGSQQQQEQKVKDDLVVIDLETQPQKKIDDTPMTPPGAKCRRVRAKRSTATCMKLKETATKLPICYDAVGPARARIEYNPALRNKFDLPMLFFSHSNPPPIERLCYRDRRELVNLLTENASRDLANVSWSDALICGSSLVFATYEDSPQCIKIGEGAFGVVFVGLLHGETPVAVKLFLNKYLSQDDITKECQVLNHLSSTNATPGFVGVCLLQSNRIFHRTGLVMEYISTPQLRRTRGRFGETMSVDKYNVATGDPCLIRREDWMTLPYHLARSLSWVHERGIILNDIKSDNVLLHYDEGRGHWQPIYIDFGIACSTKDNYAHMMTVPGYRMEEFKQRYPQYAPEKIMGQPVSFKTDVYALGLLLEKLNQTFELSLDHVVLRCASADPTCRPTAAELAQLLQPDDDHG